MKLLPLKPFRATTNDFFVLTADEDKYLVKLYRGPSAQQRRDQERRRLHQWTGNGYLAPRVNDIVVPELRDESYLVMSFIEGISLREYLCRDNNDRGKKWNCLKTFFQQNSLRHQRAIKENNPDLLHYDANTGNVICAADGFYFIDFETIDPHHNVVESTAVEAATMCRWIVRDLGRTSLDKVVEIMASSYQNQQDLLQIIVQRTTARPGQFYHRWRDRQRKRKNPQEITKYDIADVLAKIL